MGVMAYTVAAKRWEHGWELHIDGIGVTQSRLLSDAEAMVRDYLAADDVPDAETAKVIIQPDLGGLEDLVLAVRAQTERAQIAQQEAAKTARNLVAQLRQAGLSVADTAAVLGVTKGRVSQLVSR
jgi:DNA-directed RNA polymerase specialized sigma24 family protein